MRALHVALGAAIAFGVSLVCFLPPGVHFVSGPIGPLIGGYVAGSRLRLSGSEAAAVGALMAIGFGATAALAFSYLDLMPNLAWQASIPLSLIGGIYVGTLGAVGVWLSGSRD